MKKMIILLSLLFSCNCATGFKQKPIDAGNPNAYRGMSTYECSAICQTYTYSGERVEMDDAGRCWCDETTCGRSKNHGGCEKCDRLKGCQ